MAEKQGDIERRTPSANRQPDMDAVQTQSTHPQNKLAAAKRKCPICQKPTATTYRPFCSKRCADVDLSRWLTGHYAVPVVEDENPAD